MKRIIGYLGSKINLFDFLEENMVEHHNKEDKKLFVDVFSGTCSVSKLINKNTQWDIISNDISKYSKILSIQTRLNNFKTKEIMSLEKYLDYLNNLELIESDFYNEFSMGGKPKTIKDNKVYTIKRKDGDKVYYENNQEFKTSRMFFKGEVGKKIDTIKEELKRMLENKEISEDMKDLLFLFLLNYINKNSKYTGIYGAYLKHDKFKKRGEVSFIDTDLIDYIYNNYDELKFKNTKSNAKEKLANDLIKSINTSKYNKDEVILYMDPPYSTRSYESNYHILDYACDLDFNINEIKENSKSGIRKEKIKNPFNSKKDTLIMFSQLIKDGLKKSNHIYISYSNEGLMKQEDIESIINSIKGAKLETFKKYYKRYTSGENKGENTGKKNSVIELIWYIKNDD